jgi:hypothetical protein
MAKVLLFSVADCRKPFVDVSCLGSGKPRWYAIGVSELLSAVELS